MGQGIAWRDVRWLARQEENRIGEATGIAVGLVAGVFLGGVIGAGVKPNSLDGPAAGGVLGGFVGVTVGAAVGAHTRQPWVELPRGGGTGAAVSLRVTFPLR
jgi:hypothetical protein